MQSMLVRVDYAQLSGTADDIGAIAELEDEIQAALGDSGDVDGHDIGATDATIYCHGRNAVEMFNLAKLTLERSSLTSRAVVTLRFDDENPLDQHQMKLGKNLGS